MENKVSRDRTERDVSGAAYAITHLSFIQNAIRVGPDTLLSIHPRRLQRKVRVGQSQKTNTNLGRGSNAKITPAIDERVKGLISGPTDKAGKSL